MVKLLYVLNGLRSEVVVPYWQAKHKNKELFLAGAAVYWSEPC